MIRQRFLLSLSILLVVIGCSLPIGIDVSGPHLSPIPKRDIVFQVYTSWKDERSGELGFVNQDGSGKTIISPAREGYYKGYIVRAPFFTNGIFGFLVNNVPYVRYGGLLTMFYQGEVLPCNFTLAWQPTPVGNNGLFMGKYLWDKDGGVVLFRPLESGCPSQNLWSAEEIQEMKVIHITGFHTREALLLTGRQAYVWDISERRFQHLAWLPKGCVGELSPDDRRLACLIKKPSESTFTTNILVQVWDMENHQMQRYHFIPAALIPNYTYPISVSWSPNSDALVYHRCIKPNMENPLACEEKGYDNLGIYIWDLETNEERLVTTGGVFPYWINWGSSP